MFFNLLAGENQQNQGSPIGTYIMLAVAIVLLVVMFIFNSRSQKKKQEEAAKLLNAIKPGNKVKTIGGICGVVAEVNAEEGTFVLETGSEATGKSYITLDKQAIFQSDVSLEDAPAEAPATEEAAPAEEVVEAPATEEAAPVEEAVPGEVEAPAEAPVEE